MSERAAIRAVMGFMGSAPCSLRSENRASIFGEDGGGRAALLSAGGPLVEVFLPRHIDLGPVSGADTHGPGGADAFDDEVGCETNLDAAAPQRHLACRLCDVQNRPS